MTVDTTLAASHTMYVGGPLLLAETLVSFWKPLLFVPPFIVWGYIISSVLDKHAARFFLAREKWGAAYLFCGFAAIMAAVLMPPLGSGGSLTILVSLLVFCLLLAAPCLAYVVASNKDERVPEAFRITLKSITGGLLGGQKKAKAVKTGKSEIAIKSPDKSVVPVPAAATPEYELRVFCEAPVVKGLNTRATHIDLKPASKETYALSTTIDGVPSVPETIPAAQAARFIDFWKAAAKLDLQERRKKQTADITLERGDVRNVLRVNTIGGQNGVRLTLAFDPSAQVRRKAEELGLMPAQLEQLKALAQDQKGVVLVASPPQGGRTTTMYSIVKLHDAYLNNVQTVETEIADSLEGVRQNKFDATSDGPEYSTLVRSILRRDPQVVAVADVPDAATAKEIVKADTERTRVYVGLRAGSATEAIGVWLRTFGEDAQGREMAAKTLSGVVSEKLLRRLCPNCRAPYQPTPEVLKKLGLPADKIKQLFKKGGEVLIKNKPEICPVCNGSGYLGQEGAFEVFRIESAERELIAQQNWNGLRAELRKKQLPTLQTAAIAKAVSGNTSLEEVIRITAEPQPAAGGGAGGGGGGGAAKPAAAPAAPQTK